MQELLYKDDWTHARLTWSNWWSNNGSDSMIAGICVSREERLRGYALSQNNSRGTTDWASQWLDIQGNLERHEYEFAHTYYLGVQFPWFAPNIGPGALGVFLGAKPVFSKDTVWYELKYDDLTSADLVLDPDNKWWKWMLDALCESIERSRGKYIVAVPDLIENLDTLAALFGTVRVLEGLLDYPDHIHRLQEQVLDAWYDVFGNIYSQIEDSEGGVAFGYFHIWAPGKMAKVQCDISAMLSPQQFDEFVLPYLKMQCDWLDYSLYHLDGPDAVRHLDSLLSIDSLDCIQWTPGAGNADCFASRWYELYEKVFEAGKSLQVTLAPEQVQEFVRRFKGKRVHVLTYAYSLDDACRLLEAF